MKLKCNMPKGKSKKIYLDFYLRQLKRECHIYWVSDGLYIASVPKGNIDPRKWIDKNLKLIHTRKWIDSDRYKITATLL